MTTTTIQTLESLAHDFTALCRQGNFEGAVKAFYHPDIISIETKAMPGQPLEVQGLAAIAQKAQRWFTDNEIHSCQVSDPLISDNEFAVVFDKDLTHRPTNQRCSLKELAVYEVRQGKIIRERFVYRAD